MYFYRLRLRRLLIVTRHIFDLQLLAKGQAKRRSYRETLSQEGTCRGNAVQGVAFQPRQPLSSPPLDPLCYASEVVTVISDCRRYFQAFASSLGLSSHPVSGRWRISRKRHRVTFNSAFRSNRGGIDDIYK